MRRHLASCSAVVAVATASLGLCAGAAYAAGSAAVPAGQVSSPATTPTASATPIASTASATPTASTTLASTTSTTPTASTTSTTPTASTTSTKPTKPTKPPAKPKTTPGSAKGAVSMYLPDAFFVHRKALIVPDRAMHVTGVVHPYVPGQWVTFRVFLGHKVIQRRRLRVKLSPNKRYGRFTTVVKAPQPGILHLQATHRRTAQMQGFSVTRGVASLDTHAGFGATGSFVQLIQQKLAAVHMYIPQSGVYDEKTGLALDAYHRLMGHGTSQSLDGLTVSELLDGRGSFHVRYPGDGKHVEGNLGSQLLALVNGSKVYAIYPISSGKPSTPTILGRFHVYMRTPGYLPDGMYYSDFFTGGYAIHGYDPAPDYPASHGCMRVPITDAISIWDWLSIGIGVDVYE